MLNRIKNNLKKISMAIRYWSPISVKKQDVFSSAPFSYSE